MIEYLKMAHTGVKGVVKFQDGSRVKHVTVKVDSREPFQKTDRNGEYYKILLPGKYNLRVAFGCEDIYQTTIEVPSAARLLEFNITIHNRHINKYRAMSLNQYGVFCSSSSKLQFVWFYLILGVIVKFYS